MPPAPRHKRRSPSLILYCIVNFKVKLDAAIDYNSVLAPATGGQGSWSRIAEPFFIPPPQFS